MAMLFVYVLCLTVYANVYADSCQGRCGAGLNNEFTCQCNSACLTYGDCCTDYSALCLGATCAVRCDTQDIIFPYQCDSNCDQYGECYATATCAGRCDTQGIGFPCQCDSDCSTYGDCCTDYQQLCSMGSCSGRCNQALSSSYTCQCNSACSNYGDCCHDYAALCQSNGAGSGTPGTDPVSGIMNDLWLSDSNRLLSSDYSINQAGSKLFTSVNTAKLNTGTYQLFINLLDNYNHNIGVSEPLEASEVQEVQAFLDGILATEVMELAYQFLLSAGKVTSRANFRAALEELWFIFYPRSSSNNVVDSSGFEHVMVGELKGSNTVSGFHSWIQFYLEEQAGRLTYDSMVSTAEPNLKGAAFNWNGRYKSKGSFFLGTSPEFDLAVYSICAMLYPGSTCTFTLQGYSLTIQTYDIAHKAGLQMGTAYPAI